MRHPPIMVPHTCGHCGQTRETLNGAWLKWNRQKAGIGLRELSRRCGLSPAYLSDIERGNRHASERVEAIYKAFVEAFV